MGQQYKVQHDEQLERIASMEQDLKVTDSLKQQVEEYKQKMIKYRVMSSGAEADGNSKLGILQEENVRLQTDNDRLERQLEVAKKDIQDLEEILKEARTVGTDDNSLGMSLGGEADSSKQRIVILEAELKRSIPKSEHMETLDQLDTQKQLVEQLTQKLREQSKTLQREVRNEQSRDSGKIDDLERKLDQFKDKLSAAQEAEEKLTKQVKDLERDKGEVVASKVHIERRLKALQESQHEEKDAHS